MNELGALVISLDFEIAWGIDRDKIPSYSRNLAGVRTVVPSLLELFEEFSVAATWATVGMLFASRKDELHEFMPQVRPEYADSNLNTYLQAVGEDEGTDPFHYASSLIEQIRQTPRQEIGTHTFSHYYCREKGQDAHTFEADIAAAVAIAAARGISLRSIVFPRNQHEPAYDPILKKYGIQCYRGNAPGQMWEFGNRAESRRLTKRMLRGIDTYLPVQSAAQKWEDVLQPTGLSNVAAAHIVRPFRKSAAFLEGVRLRRVRHAIENAARHNRIFHIWWHPHNFGICQEENLLHLRKLLEAFRTCRSRDGMRSLSMLEVDSIARHLTLH